MIDFAISDNGDLLLSESRDITACEDERLRKQMALCRIKSVSKDWNESHIGSDLEQFLGQSADSETLEKMKTTVINALCFDGYFAQENIYINTSLTQDSYVKMLVYIKALNKKGSFCIDVNLDFVKGVNVVIGG